VMKIMKLVLFIRTCRWDVQLRQVLRIFREKIIFLPQR
jgi:hypothetical protein